MSLKERDIVLTGKDADGNSTIDLPITRLGNVETTADVKNVPALADYIPLVDSADDAQMKKVLVSALAELLGIDVDDALSTTSTNPVQNKAVAAALNKKAALNDDGVVPVDQGGTGASTLDALTQSITETVAGSADLAAALGNAIGGCKIQTGSYTGTGTYGANNPCSLTFDFVPTLAIVAPRDSGGGFGMSVIQGQNGGSTNYTNFSGATLTWYTYQTYTTAAASQYNAADVVYVWVAVG